MSSTTFLTLSHPNRTSSHVTSVGLTTSTRLAKGSLCRGCSGHSLQSFTEAKERTWFSILSLIPSIKGRGNKLEDSSLQDVELLLGEALENLTKMDITIDINPTVLPQMGLFMCANMVLFHTFAQVQSTSPEYNSFHPTPFLVNAAMSWGTSSPCCHSRTQLQDTASKPSLTVLACLNSIVTCTGKEASNMDKLQNAHQENWSCSTSA